MKIATSLYRLPYLIFSIIRAIFSFKIRITLVSILAIFTLSTCTKPYNPQFKGSTVEKYVVQGMISNQVGWQEVNISLNSSVNNPMYIPVDFCEVEIIDDQKNIFKLNQSGPGNYEVWMTADELVIGRGYKVKITTEDGIELESDYDYIPNGPAVGDIYFEIEDQLTNSFSEWRHGIQIYTNMMASDSNSRYFRWKLTETWEYHSEYPLEFYYNGEVNQISPPDSSEMICYRTRLTDEIVILSTKNFISNNIDRFPIHYIENNSARLAILYSLLIDQIALSKDAFTYWDQLRQNSEGQVGLYTTQPIAIRGNIKNISSPEYDVLGFFQASFVSSKRIFIEPIPELELDFHNGCIITHLEYGLVEVSPTKYPVYLLSFDGVPSDILLSPGCIFCTRHGGVTQKPDFWPN